MDCTLISCNVLLHLMGDVTVMRESMEYVNLSSSDDALHRASIHFTSTRLQPFQ